MLCSYHILCCLKHRPILSFPCDLSNSSSSKLCDPGVVVVDTLLPQASKLQVSCFCWLLVDRDGWTGQRSGLSWRNHFPLPSQATYLSKGLT